MGYLSITQRAVLKEAVFISEPNAAPAAWPYPDLTECALFIQENREKERGPHKICPEKDAQSFIRLP